MESHAVDRRRLGTTDIDLTPIGLGCMQFAGPGLIEGFFRPLDQEAITGTVRAAVDGGIGWFDTAEAYGNGFSERSLSSALHELGVPPDKAVIATKWSPLFRTASSIGRTIDARLTALSGYPIALHQIHMPYGSLSSISAEVRAMAALCREHKVTAVGVSNFSARLMENASEILRSQGLTLASNQVQMSLLHRNIERNDVLRVARRLGVTLIAYSPLRSGILTGKFHDDPARVRSLPRMRRLLREFRGRGLARTAPLIDELRKIGQAYGASPGQVALSWLISYYGDTVVAIPGASKPRHATESAGAMHLHLTEKELATLDELSRR